MTAPLNAAPRSFDVGDPANDIDIEQDSGFVDTTSVDSMFVGPNFGDDGEVWQVVIEVQLSSEPTDNIIVLRAIDANDNVIARDILGDYGGYSLDMTFTADSASVGGSVDYEIETVGSDSTNWFANSRAVRLRAESRTDRQITEDDASAETFDGTL